MDYAALYGSLVAVHFLALISPGPNVLLVTQTAISRTRPAGIMTALGIATGALVWSSTAMGGLNFLADNLAWLYWTLRLFGGVYLFYLGIVIWRRADQAFFSDLQAEPRSAWQAYRLGIATNMTNPKAAIFFGGIFTAIFPPNLPSWAVMASIGSVFFNSFVFHSALALFASTQRVKALYDRCKCWVDRATGTVLFVLGLRLVLEIISGDQIGKIHSG